MTTWLSWSSGKDSAWTLHHLRRSGHFEVTGLFTAVNSSFDRVAMHAVRRTLLEDQASATGLPLLQVPLPWPCTNAEYEKAMSSVWERARLAGVQTVAFGDLFLEDVRDYRIRTLKGTGLEPIFPLWKLPTRELAESMIDGGLEAKITCVDPSRLDPTFAGRAFDTDLLADLPDGVDPCGENGEFHSFVHAGPMFDHALGVTVGQVVERDGFVFADLL